jgi:hypothetical protein
MENFNYNSGYIRSDIEKAFTEVCKDDLLQFNLLCEIVERMNEFLRINSMGEGSLEHYVRLINIRIGDHITSATILMGKGFVVDAINLVRSSYEDLWLIQNMFFNEGYFEEWKSGKEVRPWRLRQLKEIEDIKEENEIIYKALCNIAHCSVSSVDHMSEFGNKIEVIANDFKLLLMTYYSCCLQIIEAFEEYYGTDDEEILSINNALLGLDIVMN